MNPMTRAFESSTTQPRNRMRSCQVALLPSDSEMGPLVGSDDRGHREGPQQGGSGQEADGRGD